jgi:hypothetical protein
MDLSYFKPIKRQVVGYRDVMLLRLQSSSITRRIKLISFKYCEAVMQGQESRYQAIFGDWIQKFEEELCAMWRQSSSSQVVQTYLLAEALEVR